MKTIALLALPLLALAACNKAPETAAMNTTTAVEAPTSGKWIETVSKTADGGIIMGNPDAKVKLVEYGALSCSHCAEFSEASHAALMTKIAAGTLSFEFRPFLLNALDVPSSVLARCGTPAQFFPISKQLYAAQGEWLGKTKDISQAEQASFTGMQPVQQSAFLAEKLGLIAFVQARGIGADQAKACLADTAAIDELGKMSEVAQTKFKVSGTPTFVINGETVPNAASWEALEPALKAAGA